MSEREELEREIAEIVFNAIVCIQCEFDHVEIGPIVDFILEREKKIREETESVCHKCLKPYEPTLCPICIRRDERRKVVKFCSSIVDWGLIKARNPDSMNVSMALFTEHWNEAIKQILSETEEK